MKYERRKVIRSSRPPGRKSMRAGKRNVLLVAKHPCPNRNRTARHSLSQVCSLYTFAGSIRRSAVSHEKRERKGNKVPERRRQRLECPAVLCYIMDLLDQLHMVCCQRFVITHNLSKSLGYTVDTSSTREYHIGIYIQYAYP